MREVHQGERAASSVLTSHSPADFRKPIKIERSSLIICWSLCYGCIVPYSKHLSRRATELMTCKSDIVGKSHGPFLLTRRVFPSSKSIFTFWPHARVVTRSDFPYGRGKSENVGSRESLLEKLVKRRDSLGDFFICLIQWRSAYKAIKANPQVVIVLILGKDLTIKSYTFHFLLFTNKYFHCWQSC